ncbi:MAG: carboxypeptidase regulatory-like domain-containing protein, partial [Acidobacteria bacterium]|nr:carboxypeptidase regulatory-like domain-containing protein [Acidobacteriota bacterium]
MTRLTGTALGGCVLLHLLVFAAPVAAQLDTATVIGIVSDAQGAVIPGATVTAVNKNSGFVRATATD